LDGGMGRAVRFAIAIPQVVPDGDFERTLFARYMAEAEQLGFESAWVQEHVLGTSSVLAPLETLTFAAAMTSTLRLGCAVFVSSVHSPVHLAKAVSSLDQLSRGRVELGLAVGEGSATGFGVGERERVGRFVEGLGLMKACWTQSPIDHRGRFWQVENGSMEPKPFQKPYPPIWIGARKLQALRRVALLGDGFYGAGMSSTAQFREQVDVLRDALVAAGRQPEEFPIAKRVYIAVDEDATRASKALEEGLERLYGTHIPAAVGIAGSPNVCSELLAEVIDAGASLIQLNPVHSELDQMRRLAVEVVPLLA
jgi:probable F420-dependent oxidoreductase